MWLQPATPSQGPGVGKRMEPVSAWVYWRNDDEHRNGTNTAQGPEEAK
jgi:hypothetical protein